MISYRKADLIDKIKESDKLVGVVRVVHCYYMDGRRCITGYLLQLFRNNGDGSQMKSTVKFADDVWVSLPANITNSYKQNPEGFSHPFRGDLSITMVSENYNGGIPAPDPDFIASSIETKFKHFGIENTHKQTEEMIAPNGNEVTLVAEYPIRWSNIPQEFKTVKADLIDKLKRKQEWKEFRVNRMVSYLFRTWQSYWGSEAEFHSPEEMLSSLVNIPNHGFVQSIKQEQPLILEEFKEFMDNPEMRKMLLDRIEGFAKNIGWSGPLGIREADLIDKIRDTPTELSINFHVNKDTNTLRFTSIQYPNGEIFTDKIQKRRDYIENILRNILTSYGFFEELNNWVKVFPQNSFEARAIMEMRNIRTRVKTTDSEHRIMSCPDELEIRGNDRYSIIVVVK